MPRRAPGPVLVDFDLRVTGDREVAALFNDVHGRVRTRVQERLERITAEVEQAGAREVAALTKTGKGRLMRGWKHRYRSTPTSESTLIFHRERYFYMLSSGSPKNAVMRKAHTRHVKSQDRTGITRARLSKRGDKTLIRYGRIAQGVAFVKEHPMKVKLQARPFLSRAWVALGGAGWATQEIGAAVAEGVNDAKSAVAGGGEGI
jgi:hypothetical protein